MKYRIALRTASVLAIMHAVMHQLGMSNSPTDHAELAVTSSMQSFKMSVMGSSRSYWDFFAGMGLFLTIALVSFGILLWLLSGLKKEDRIVVRPLLLVIGLTFSVFTIAAMKYFFAAPIIMEGLIAALVLFAYFNCRRVA